MQINSGLRSVLAVPGVYRLFARFLGNNAAKQWFVDDILCLRDGQKVVDVGCGPAADIIARIPAVEYLGLDISDAYIQAARAKFKDRRDTNFLSGNVKDWAHDPLTFDADLVLANGVLHHINDDEVMEILKFSYAALKDNGRLVFYEPCYLAWQSKLSARFMSFDRGQNIRTEQQWKDLASSVFPVISTSIVTGVNLLGYVCIIVQCRKSAPTNASLN